MTLSGLRSYLFTHRHTTLLAALVTTLAVRPLVGDAGVGPLAFSFAMLALLLVALYTIQVDELVGEWTALLAERRRRSILGWTLAALATAERVSVIFSANPRLFLVGRSLGCCSSPSSPGASSEAC